MTSPYGSPPTQLGTFNLDPTEMQFTLYMPVMLPSRHTGCEFTFKGVPPNLRFMQEMLLAALLDATHTGPFDPDHYVYVTCKTLFVQPGAPGNRPGWHVDGWGSNGDLNYIWYDMNPTEFAVQTFVDIPDDDVASMAAMEAQVHHSCIWTYPERTLLRLDEGVVHRVGPVVRTGIRTFVKISMSKHQYNLKGNSHNYMLDYDWEMVDRVPMRNVDNKDFAKHE